MLRKLTALLTLGLIFFPTLGYCLCQMPADMPDCHRPVSESDCCCSREVEMPEDMPDAADAVPAPVFKLPEWHAFSGPAVSPSPSGISLPVLQVVRAPSVPLRSPPVLYLHHASFLI